MPTTGATRQGRAYDLVAAHDEVLRVAERLRELAAGDVSAPSEPPPVSALDRLLAARSTLIVVLPPDGAEMLSAVSAAPVGTAVAITLVVHPDIVHLAPCESDRRRVRVSAWARVAVACVDGHVVLLRGSTHRWSAGEMERLQLDVAVQFSVPRSVWGRSGDSVRLPDGLVGSLMSGDTDEAAARGRGTSLRSHRRHVAELMRSMGAASRFQLGYRLALLMGVESWMGFRPGPRGRCRLRWGPTDCWHEAVTA